MTRKKNKLPAEKEEQPPQDVQDVQLGQDVQHEQDVQETKPPFSAEQVDYLKQQLGLVDITRQFESILEARDKKLVETIKVEMVKDRVNAAAAGPQQAGHAAGPRASNGPNDKQDLSNSPFGQVIKDIVNALNPPQESSEGQLTRLFMDRMLKRDQLIDEYLTRRILGEAVREPGRVSHVSG